jgi:hypothetical protein
MAETPYINSLYIQMLTKGCFLASITCVALPARFKRQSIIVSKSTEMMDLIMALFAKFGVNGNQDELLSLLG